MNKQLLLKSIQIAKKYPQEFGCTMLKEKLHICTREANQILHELSNCGVIEMQIFPTYKMCVKI